MKFISVKHFFLLTKDISYSDIIIKNFTDVFVDELFFEMHKMFQSRKTTRKDNGSYKKEEVKHRKDRAQQQANVSIWN